METKTFPLLIGLPVYLEPTGNNKLTRNVKLDAGKISKIGNKYFYVSFDNQPRQKPAKFNKETFVCWDNDTNAGYNIYLWPELFEEEQERKKKLSTIRDFISKHSDDLPYGVVCEVFYTLMRWNETSGDV